MDSGGLAAANRPCLEGVGTHVAAGDRTRRALPPKEKARTTVAGQCRVLTGFAEHHAYIFDISSLRRSNHSAAIAYARNPHE